MDFSSYTVFDVETANQHRASICSIGIVRVENKHVVLSKEYLINPECEFALFNTRIHKITSEAIKDKPVFSEIWPSIRHYFEDTLVVAHNAKSMDLCALYRTMEKYNLPIPKISYACTYELAQEWIPRHVCDRYKLDVLCNALNIQLESHHNALDDAMACKELFERIIQISNGKIATQGYEGPSSPAPTDTYHASKPIYSEKTQAMQQLQNIVYSVLADRLVSDQEAKALLSWMEKHNELEGYYPYDKLFTVIRTILLDNVVSEEEEITLLNLLDAFTTPEFSTPEASTSAISLTDKTVCLSGDFDFGSKKEVENWLVSKGATVVSSVTKKIDILILGQGGSAAWKYENYGSKYEKAKQLNEKGCSIAIYKEKDVIGE